MSEPICFTCGETVDCPFERDDEYECLDCHTGRIDRVMESRLWNGQTLAEAIKSARDVRAEEAP